MGVEQLHGNVTPVDGRRVAPTGHRANLRPAFVRNRRCRSSSGPSRSFVPYSWFTARAIFAHDFSGTPEIARFIDRVSRSGWLLFEQREEVVALAIDHFERPGMVGCDHVPHAVRNSWRARAYSWWRTAVSMAQSRAISRIGIPS